MDKRRALLCQDQRFEISTTSNMHERKQLFVHFLCNIHAYFPFDIRIFQESEYHTDNVFIFIEKFYCNNNLQEGLSFKTMNDENDVNIERI